MLAAVFGAQLVHEDVQDFPAGFRNPSLAYKVFEPKKRSRFSVGSLMHQVFKVYDWQDVRLCLETPLCDYMPDDLSQPTTTRIVRAERARGGSRVGRGRGGRAGRARGGRGGQRSVSAAAQRVESPETSDAEDDANDGNDDDNNDDDDSERLAAIRRVRCARVERAGPVCAVGAAAAAVEVDAAASGATRAAGVCRRACEIEPAFMSARKHIESKSTLALFGFSLQVAEPKVIGSWLVVCVDKSFCRTK